MIFIRIILFIVLLYVGFAVYRYVKASLAGRPDDRIDNYGKDENSPQTMVRDPVCGVYIPVKDALVLKRNRGAFFFCSQECLEKFTHGDR